jgi:hypothetical protein
MRIAGIDPGANGALVILDNNKIETYTFPKVGGKLSIDLMVRQLVGVLKTVDKVYIEEVHGIKGSASKATFSFGYTCGAIRAAAVIAGVPYEMVQPKKWQKECWVTSDYVYKSSKTGRKQNNTKATSMNCALRLFPKESWGHDGIVDAALIAYYGIKYTAG